MCGLETVALKKDGRASWRFRYQFIRGTAQSQRSWKGLDICRAGRVEISDKGWWRWRCQEAGRKMAKSLTLEKVAAGWGWMSSFFSAWMLCFTPADETFMRSAFVFSQSSNQHHQQLFDIRGKIKPWSYSSREPQYFKKGVQNAQPSIQTFCYGSNDTVYVSHSFSGWCTGIFLLQCEQTGPQQSGLRKETSSEDRDRTDKI